MVQPNLISFVGVAARYEIGPKILSNVSLNINGGQFFFLTGKSGSGKTTLLRLIYQLHPPSSGHIKLFGKNTKGMAKDEVIKLRRQMSIIFQEYSLISHLSVFDNVAFALRVIGASKRDIRRKVPVVLELVGLSGKENVRASELSGGEKQRVGLARAIINNPPILLCDEPTGNLDPATALEIMDILEKINAHGTTILVVTHANSIVDRMKKRVIEIEDGEIVRDQKQGVYAI